MPQLRLQKVNQKKSLQINNKKLKKKLQIKSLPRNMQTMITPLAISASNSISHNSSIYSRRVCPSQSLKLQLISQIYLQLQANYKLQTRQQMLQNTVYDVRKLIEVSNNENQETIEYLHKEIEKMSIKKSQYKAVLTLVQGNNNHLQKCMLFWNSFP